MSRVRDALPALAAIDRAPLIGEFSRSALRSTRSGAAKLIELDDDDARKLSVGDTLVARFGYGLAAVEVVQVKTGVAGEQGFAFEVPVIEARTPTGQVLAYAPEELCRVREPKGGRS